MYIVKIYKIGYLCDDNLIETKTFEDIGDAINYAWDLPDNFVTINDIPYERYLYA